MATRSRQQTLPALFVLLCLGSPVAEGRDAPAPVEIATASRGAVTESLELTGSVTAAQRASLSSRTAGLVQEVSVDAGSRVTKGDILLQLDKSLARLALEKAKAEAEAARTGAAEAKRLFEEGRTLAKSGSLPASQAQTRENTLAAAEAELKRLETAAREQAEILDRHDLVAPFDGVVTEKMTEAGEWVETGNPVLELVGARMTRFDVQAPQELYGSLPEDTRVEVALDSRDAKDFPARIAVKVPFKDPVTRTFLVRLKVEAPEDEIVPGMSGRARFFLRSEKPAITVPRDAIVRRPDGSAAVWVVDRADGIATVNMRKVEIGRRMQSTVEVRSGLEDGQQVVVKGNESLQDGQPVDILGRKIEGS